jgi:hypothetical protein
VPFTYNILNLSTPLARVRLRLGDTNPLDFILHDEEINAILSDTNDVTVTAFQCCELILARFARDIDASGGPISTQRSQKFQHYKDLLERLARELAIGATCAWGGTSKQGDRAHANDPDFQPPRMAEGMDDYK